MEIKQRRVYQLVDLDRTASSLEAGDGFETNHAGRHCIQFSLVMHAQDTPDLLSGDLQFLADLCGWVNEQTGIRNKWAKTYGPNEGIVLASESSPIRMTPVEWYAWDGWATHQHVPSNSHWDCGALDVQTIQELIAAKENAVDPMLVRDGGRRYRKGDPAAVEWVRSSLALLGLAPGPKGQNLDAAVVRFKRRFMGRSDAEAATVTDAVYQALVLAVLEYVPAPAKVVEVPVEVSVPDPAMAAKVSQLEDKIARARAVLS